MHSHRNRTLRPLAPVTLAALLLALVADSRAQTAPAAGDAAPADAKDGAPVVLPVITVSASKRRERLMDAPAAITSLSSEKVENLGVESFQGYAGLVPNLNLSGGSVPGQGTIVIRGLYSGVLQTTNTTAFYIGESPFSGNGAFALGSFITPDVDLLDVARIEVLKGPQGTLYGATSLGGLIRLVPKLPDTSAFSGSIRLGASKVQDGGDGYTGKVLLNVPLAKDLLALQVGAFKRRDGGFTKNQATGSDEQGEATSQGGGATLLLTPQKGLQFTLRALSQTLSGAGLAAQDNLLGTGAPTIGERTYSLFFDPKSRAKFDIVEVAGEWESASGTLTGAISQTKYNLAYQGDGNSYAELFRPTYCGAFPANCTPAPGYNGIFDVNPALTKHNAELRFASRRIGAFEYLAGLFATEEKSNYHVMIRAVNNALAPAAAPFDNIIDSTTVGTYREQAVFGNLTYYLSDAVDLTVGVRRASNKQHFLIAGTGLLGRQGVPIHSEDDSTTYQLTGRWRVSSDLSTFARIATGYRPGGPQNNPAAPNPTFDPDKVTNYEVGLKGQALGGRLSWDASIYHIDWKDIQLNGLLGGIVIVGNAGKAVINGLEAQLTYSDPSGFSGGASFGLNQTELKSIGTTTAAYLGAAVGDPLPLSPKLTAALYADYRFPLGRVQGNVGATLRHQGEKHANFSQPSIYPDYLIPAYTTLDLRASVNWDQYTLRFGIDNATNENGIASYSTTRVLATQVVNSQATLIRPRTYTVSLAVEF